MPLAINQLCSRAEPQPLSERTGLVALDERCERRRVDPAQLARVAGRSTTASTTCGISSRRTESPPLTPPLPLRIPAKMTIPLPSKRSSCFYVFSPTLSLIPIPYVHRDSVQACQLIGCPISNPINLAPYSPLPLRLFPDVITASSPPIR